MASTPAPVITTLPRETEGGLSEIGRLRDELAEARAQIRQLEAAWSETWAERNRLEARLAEAQETISHLMAENRRLQQEVAELKQAPFKSRKRKRSREQASTKKPGRKAGHPGSGRERAAIHVDETGWRIDGENHWLWVFVNEVVALYLISHSRGSKVPKAMLGQDFEGTVISDFFSAYSPLEVKKAKCWAHLLRESHNLTKGKPPPPSRNEYAFTKHCITSSSR